MAEGTVGDFRHLMSPGRIADLTVPNRLVMAAMDMNLCHGGHFDEAEVEHFVARARGGTGLVITGASAVGFPVGATSLKQPGLADDDCIPGLRLLADGVHAAGGRVCVQLVHHGKTSAVDTAQGRPLLVPSVPLPKADMRVLVDARPEELRGLGNAREGKRDQYAVATDEDLRAVVRMFADAARRAKEAGIDAVEVHAGHGYLLSTFLSAGYNQRTDQWGGSVANRARLTCEVIEAIRGEVGPGYPILVKFNGTEYLLDHGIDADEAVRIAELLERAGADALDISGYSNDPFAGFTFGPLPAQVAAYRSVTARIKQAVGIPVIAVGRMLPEVAEEMLAAGECDLIAEGRWQLTDPEMGNKIAAGRRDSVRPCINCYVCVERNFFNDTPVCTVNPTLGDPQRQVPGPAARPRHVVVVGGGPAGMETARLAAQSGHRVTLVERNRHLGGTGWFSQLTTPPNGFFLRWQEHELREAGVQVHTNTLADPASIAALAPDVVVVATGARRERPPVPGVTLPHVQSGDDLRDLITGAAAPSGSGPAAWLARILVFFGRLLGLTKDPDRIRSLSRVWMPVGKRVVVLGGGLVGLELAEFLAERKREVTVLEEGPTIGLPLAMPRRLAEAAKAAGHGVHLVRNAQVLAIDTDAVRYRVGEREHSAPADTVVLASGTVPDPGLAERLRAAGHEVHVAGDSSEVGYFFGAVRSAWDVAAQL